MLGNFIGVLFDGVAYGALLFVIAIGLSITLGLMNLINLAHGAFAMLGGYVTTLAMSRLGVPFYAALLLAFAVAGVVGGVLERTLYRRLYRRTPLDQVLFTIGLTFMAMAATTYFFGPSQQPVRVPEYLTGQVNLLGRDFGAYRLFLIVVVAVIALALTWVVEKTRIGAQVRAAVDNRVAAEGLGIDVDRVFTLVFMLGSALAGLGGGLAIDVLGLDPVFPLKYMVYFLLVVAVGGAGSIGGTLAAALLLGIFDVAGKYYLPSMGSFIIYFLLIVLLVLFPGGLVAKRG